MHLNEVTMNLNGRKRFSPIIRTHWAPIHSLSFQNVGGKSLRGEERLLFAPKNLSIGGTNIPGWIVNHLACNIPSNTINSINDQRPNSRSPCSREFSNRNEPHYRPADGHLKDFVVCVIATIIQAFESYDMVLIRGYHRGLHLHRLADHKYWCHFLPSTHLSLTQQITLGFEEFLGCPLNPHKALGRLKGQASSVFSKAARHERSTEWQLFRLLHFT